MGTYTQPTQILDKRHSEVQKGFDNLTSLLEAQLAENKKEKKKELEELEKQKKLNDLRQVDIEEIRQKQAAANLKIVHNLGPDPGNTVNIQAENGNIIPVNLDDLETLKKADENKDQVISDEEAEKYKIGDEVLQLQEDFNIFHTNLSFLRLC